MALDRQYVIPLRKALKAPRTRRAPKAVKLVEEFLMRHMKGTEVKMGTSLNEALWKDGIKNIPARIKVHAVRDDNNVVRCDLPQVAIRTEAEEKKAREIHEKAKQLAAEKKAAAAGLLKEEEKGENNKEEEKEPDKKKELKEKAPHKVEEKKSK